MLLSRLSESQAAGSARWRLSSSRDPDDAGRAIVVARKPAAPPGEQDLLLKLAMRRIFWGMNYATRVNLKLGLPGRGRSADELTDLDVVGFSTGLDFSVRLLIADCKSSSKVSPSGRVFWLAGVRQFFGADRAYLVVERDVPPGAREAAGRLGIDVLAKDERTVLENVHGPHAPAGPFFAVDGALRLEGLMTGFDRRLQPLVQCPSTRSGRCRRNAGCSVS